jgi:hypothetical protein
MRGYSECRLHKTIEIEAYRFGPNNGIQRSQMTVLVIICIHMHVFTGALARVEVLARPNVDHQETSRTQAESPTKRAPRGQWHVERGGFPQPHRSTISVKGVEYLFLGNIQEPPCSAFYRELWKPLESVLCLGSDDWIFTPWDKDVLLEGIELPRQSTLNPS